MQTTEIQRLRQRISELESHLRLDSEQWQMELESVRTGNLFREAKLLAAEKKADELMQEVQRLMYSQEELKRRCRDNDVIVQQMAANAENDQRRVAEDVLKLEAKISSQTEALKDNARILQEKAVQELKLRDTINSLGEQLNRATDEAQSGGRLVPETLQRPSSRLRSRFSSFLDVRRNPDQQLRQQQAAEKLAAAEKTVLEMQMTMTVLQTEVGSIRAQLQEVITERDKLGVTADQLQSRFQEELLRSSRLSQSLTLRLDREREMESDLLETRHRLKQAEEAIEFYREKLKMEEARDRAVGDGL